MTFIDHKDKSYSHTTQQEMADRIRVSRVTVVRWETGQQPVPGPVTVLMDLLRRREREGYDRAPERAAGPRALQLSMAIDAPEPAAG